MKSMMSFFNVYKLHVGGTFTTCLVYLCGLMYNNVCDIDMCYDWICFILYLIYIYNFSF